MFRAAKWKAEKTKIKVVFKLQFHATQVPTQGWDKLFVSLIPVETGKITAKTGKASVHNGSCQWAAPVYETTRLVQDVKTGKCDEKLYNFVVSTGSSRFGLLGETTIDLTNYVGAIIPSSVSLALRSCNAGTVLHVTIQRLPAKTGFRDFDKNGDLTEGEHHRVMSAEAIADDNSDESALICEGTTKGHGSEDNSVTTSMVHFSSDSHEVGSQFAEANGNYIGRTAADARSTSSSGSSYTAKREVSDVHEIGGMNSGIHQDAVSFLSSLSKNAKPPKSDSITGHSLAYARERGRSNSDWTHDRNADCFRETGEANIYEENEKLQANLRTSESTIEELQNEVSSLERQAEGLTAEMEMLKTQLAKEIRKGQEFASEISSLKVERDNTKLELEKFKALGQDGERQRTPDKARHDIDDTRCITEELKQELSYEKEVNINLNLQLQKTQDSNLELLLAVQDLEELLERKNKEIEDISSNRCLISIFGENKEASSFQDIEREWLQKLSFSEQKIREIKDKIILNDGGRSLEFVQDDMDILETAFQEARQENISLICKLNNEIDQKNKRIADLDYGMQSSPGKAPLINDIANKVEIAEIWNARSSHFDLNEDEKLNINQPSKQCIVCDIQPMQDKILQLDKIRLGLENVNQNLEEEVRMNRLDIARLEEEVRALTASNLQLETKIETLEGDNLELQNCLNATQEAGKLAREQIGELMEEMSLLSAKTESDSGIRKSTDKLTSEVENDHEDVGDTLFLGQEHDGQLLKRISELETKLKHEKQKKESQQTEKEVAEELKETERKHDSILELEQKMFDLRKEAEDYKRARDYLAKEIEQIEHEYETLKQEHEQCALGKADEEFQILRDEHAASLSTVHTLQSKIESLQQEIDKQAAKFAADLDAMELSKMEQEQRAIRAEEELRKTRWNNVSTAERLQKEFKRLSLQMSSTFDVNGKLATQAFAEASELRVQKNNLQELLNKADEEIAFIKEQLRAREQELRTQLDLAEKHGEALSKLQDTLDEVENLKKNEINYISRNEELSSKVATLNTEVQTLTDERNGLTQKVKECECLKAELDGAKIVLDNCRTEKTQLEVALQGATQDKVKLDEELSLLKERLRNSEAELKELKHCRDDQEIRVAFLESRLDEQAAQISFDSEQKNELTQLKRQHSEINHRLSDKVLETEDLRKQVVSLREELKQKTDMLAAVEKKLKEKEDNNSKVHAGGGLGRPISRTNNKVGPISRNVKELADLRDKVKLLEGEVKAKTIALEALRQDFNAKEKSLQIKIEQLEMINQNLKQEHLNSSMDQLQDEVKEQVENINSRFEEPTKGGNATDSALSLEMELGDALEANHIYKKQLQSALVNVFTKQQNEQAAALQNFRDVNELLNDLVALRKKNTMMEDELKEMHDRYSQISLKFAEVEGERQELVMIIKNLKNGKKS